MNIQNLLKWLVVCEVDVYLGSSNTSMLHHNDDIIYQLENGGGLYLRNSVATRKRKDIDELLLPYLGVFASSDIKVETYDIEAYEGGFVTVYQFVFNMFDIPSAIENIIYINSIVTGCIHEKIL